ncbi:hypothetical protein L7F22_067283 [Adiantum nelumboides]|nr:hypothetical protein [Adiantum nelumboides]
MSKHQENEAPLVSKLSSEKPWKQKRKPAQSLKEVEIFEGKPIVPTPSLVELTSVEDGYIKILCMHDCTFWVPRKVVDSFKCIDVILYSEVSFRERLENVIRFPDMSSEVMEAVLRFVFTDHLNKLKAERYWGCQTPRLVFQFEVTPTEAMDLIHAAHFLGVENLLNVAATMVAHNLKDVQDLSFLPSDLAWCIAEQLSFQDLFLAEERSDFLALNLDTEILWKKHCKSYAQEDIVPVSKASAYPPYDVWELTLGPPPRSWKSLCITAYLQQIADRQDGGDTESFLSEVSQKGQHVYSVTKLYMIPCALLKANNYTFCACIEKKQRSPFIFFPQILCLLLVLTAFSLQDIIVPSAAFSSSSWELELTLQSPQSFYTSASNSMQQEQRPPRPPYRPSNRPILCYRCGEYGHYQSKCALPEGSPPCHHCPDSKDHYSKDCPKQRASSSSGSTQNQQEFTFPKINLTTVNTIPQPSTATHVVDPQQVGESAGVLTRAQRAALGLSLPTRLSPPSPIPQDVSSNKSFTGAKSRPNSILSDIDGAFLEAVADLQQQFIQQVYINCEVLCRKVGKSMARGTRHTRHAVQSKNQPSSEQESSAAEEGEEEESTHSSHGATDMTSSDASDESYKIPSHMADPDFSSQSDSGPSGRPQANPKINRKQAQQMLHHSINRLAKSKSQTPFTLNFYL